MAKILVVDDEPDIRFFLRHLFEAAGYEVIEASHGAAALISVDADRPDLVITDQMMPILDGNGLIARLRSNPATSSIPILSLTGNPEASVGADAIMRKTSHFTDVLEKARFLLGGN